MNNGEQNDCVAHTHMFDGQHDSDPLSFSAVLPTVDRTLS